MTTNTTNVNLQQEKMSEREVRDAIERTARRIADLQEKRGETGRSYEKARKMAEEFATTDNRKGKI